MDNFQVKLLSLGIVLSVSGLNLSSQQYQEQVAIEGSSYKMKCVDKYSQEPSPLPTAVPHTIVIWSVNGSIPQSPKYKMLTDGLVIRNISTQDVFINYTCTVLDRFTFKPLHSTNIKLKIRQRTAKLLESKGFRESANAKGKKVQVWGIMNQWVKLQCNMFARPRPIFEWTQLQTGEKITGSNSVYKIMEDESTSNLTIFLHNETFFGEYTCKAFNNHGESIQHFVLAEGYRPKSPFIYPTYIGKNRLTMKVEPQEIFRTDLTAYKIALPVTNYFIQYMEAANSVSPTAGEFSLGSRFHSRSKKWTTIMMSADEKNPYITRRDKGIFELRNLKGNMTYLIRCAVANVAAISDFSPAIRITTDAPENITQTIQDTDEDKIVPSREEYARSSNYEQGMESQLSNNSTKVTNSKSQNCTTPRYKKTLLRTTILTTTIEDLKNTSNDNDNSSLIKKRVEEDTSVERILLCNV